MTTLVKEMAERTKSGELSWKVRSSNDQQRNQNCSCTPIWHAPHSSSLPSPWVLTARRCWFLVVGIGRLATCPSLFVSDPDCLSCVLQLYAESKAMGEKAALDACSDSLLTVAIAPHQIYGPR